MTNNVELITYSKKSLAEMLMEKDDFKYTNMYTMTKTIKSFIQVLIDCLVEGRALHLHNFGHLIVTHRQDGLVKNPKSLEQHSVQSLRTVRFRKKPNNNRAMSEDELVGVMSGYMPLFSSLQLRVIIDNFKEMLSHVRQRKAKIEWRGFGTFKPRLHTYRNDMDEKTSVSIKFKPAEPLIKKLN